MTGTENSTQGQKPKTSKLAVWSLVLAPTGFVVLFVLALLVQGMITLLGPLIAFVGIALGIEALVGIRQSGGLLKGRILAVCGIFACILGQITGIYFSGKIFFHVQEMWCRETCGVNLKELGIAMQNYANENDGKYPIVDEWCDMLLEHYDMTASQFICPRVQKQERCSYAMNPNCKLNSPNDMVLLFETKTGWNQFGGPELMTMENHKCEGCNILFNDGHVEFVETEEISKLKWEDKQKE